MSVTLTEKAVLAVKEIMEENSMDIGESFLRVGVLGGGCSGFKYSMDITNSIDEEDEVWDHDGVKVVCDPKSLLYLDGTVVDFKDELMARGFAFTNPNSTSNCGCGSSFSA